MAQSILDLILRTKKQGDVKGTTQELTGLQKAAGTAKTTFTELNSVVQLAGQAMEVLKGIYNATVGTTIELGSQVRELSHSVGISAEEASRLIQVADDYKISAQELTTALQLATKNGFAPSIESLAKLSDAYLAISDPTERAAMMAEKFGRNWSTLVPILERGGDAIRESASAISEGLVFSEGDLDAIRNYEQSVDNLGDTFLALEVAISKKVVPALTSYVTELNTAITISDKTGASFFDVVNMAWKVNLGLMSAEDAAKQLAGTLDLVSYNSDTFIKNMDVGWLSTVTITGAVADLTTQLKEQGLEFGDTNAQLQTFAALQEQARNKTAELQGAVSALEAAQQSWANTAGSEVASALDKLVGDSKKWHEGLKAIDETYGTSLLPQEQYKDQMEKITAEYAKTGDVQKFKEDLAKLREEFGNTKEVEEAKKKVGELNAELAKLHDITYTITTIYKTVYENGSGGPPPTQGKPGRQHGGGVGAGELTPVGERGPEMLMLDKPGWVFTKEQAQQALSMTFQNALFQFTPQAGQTGQQSFQAFQDMLTDRAREMARNGIGSAGK